MSEAKFKKTMQRAFISYSDKHDTPLHWQLLEDSLSVGIPDISYGLRKVNGWIEAKWNAELPAPSSRYDPHFQPYQEAWLVARGTAGGNCFLVHGFSNAVIIMSHKGLMRRRPEMTIMDVADTAGCVILPYFDESAVKMLVEGEV